MNNKTWAAKALFGAVVVATGLTTSLAHAEIRWEMPTAYSAGSSVTQNYVQFAEEVHELSGGEITINVHPGGSLYPGAEIMRAVRTGQVPIGAWFMAAEANSNALFGLDTLPFIATSFDEARQLYDVSREALENEFESRGMKMLFMVPWPPQGLFHRHEINDVPDMRGTRLRAYDATTTRIADLLGATPTRTEAAEISQAFSTGMAESMFGSGAIGVFQSLWDYVDYYYTVNAWIPKSAVFVNATAWEELSEEQRQVVMDAAERTEAKGWEEIEEVTAHYNEELSANGMQVLEPSEELARGLDEIGATIVEEWFESADVISAEVLREYLSTR
ncbi:TRAP transporter substrate-binding protein [Halomonas sp. MCCC 1A11036]|uniref:TRAP transporter substrate-binding protein n=1 Tax=Billgrantia zhangzhouensis TaxID=2733481 RepID=A0ABS9AFP7_9GAMM|nr:TRAP transporter substrate-binding protein [Halomonas zhangzhouensis]MCE8020526.1 TRAP transporter substrate-binding protein [Halomonas zhangzhouensis]